MENFTAKDISTIIRACKDSGVRSLDCGGLKLNFDPDVSEEVIEQPELHFPPGDEIERHVEEDSDLRELELQNLMISDPVAYEKHMRYEDETA